MFFFFFFSLPGKEVYTAKGQKDTQAHTQKMGSNNHNGTTYDLSKRPLLLTELAGIPIWHLYKCYSLFGLYSMHILDSRVLFTKFKLYRIFLCFVCDTAVEIYHEKAFYSGLHTFYSL